MCTSPWWRPLFSLRDDATIPYAKRQLKICDLRLSWFTELYMKDPSQDNSNLVNTWRRLRHEAEQKVHEAV